MFTIYDTDKNEFTKVEEPDSSLSYTYADYLKWNFEERLELIRGRIFKMSPAPAPIHQKIVSNLTGIFYNAFKKKNCQAYPAPFDVRLPIKNKKKDNEITTVVQPDLSIICDVSKLDARGCCGAPDLIIEILSPGNNKKDLKLKYELYEEAGVPEYWVVFPIEESILVFLLNENNKYNGAITYAGGDTIRSKVVSGLVVKFNDVFTK
jgi:Uma2 family endonuclease